MSAMIEKALPIVASMYGRRYGVEIFVGGTEAKTNGQFIQLPEIPEDFPFKEALYGFLAHECAHVRYTTFDGGWPDGIHHDLYNSFEDGRIEKLFVAEYPGAADTLNLALKMFIQQGYMQCVSADSEPKDILTAFVLYWVRYVWRGQTVLQEQYESAHAAFRVKFPRGAYVRMMALLRKAPSMLCSDDAHRLADEVLDMLDEEAEEPQQSPKNSEKQDDSDKNSKDSAGESGSGNSSDESGDQDDQSGKGQGDTADDQSGKDGDDSSGQGQGGKNQSEKNGQPSSQGGESDDGKASGKKSGDQAQPGSGGQGDGSEKERRGNLKQALQSDGESHPNPFDVMKELLEKAAEENPNRGNSPQVMPGSLQMREMSEDRTAMHLGEVKATSVVIRRRLLQMVQASSRSRTYHKERGRRVSGNRLAGTVSGNMRVFRKTMRKRALNTAVYLLVDGSGSMGSGKGSTMQIANEAALAVGLALDGTPRVTPMVSYFAGSEGSAIVEAVRPGDSVERNAGRFCYSGDGGTPLASALWKVAQTFSSRHEERKIVMVVTDGGPNSPDKVRHVLGLMKRSGYECMGIGIGSDAVSKYFGDYCVINQASDLERTLFDMVQDKLVA